MTLLDQQGELEKATVEAAIAAAPLFPGIEDAKVELGEDHTGDPSLFITFRIARDFHTDEAWVYAFNDYSSKLTLRVLRQGLTRFPYHRLQRAA